MSRSHVVCVYEYRTSTEAHFGQRTSLLNISTLPVYSNGTSGYSRYRNTAHRFNSATAFLSMTYGVSRRALSPLAAPVKGTIVLVEAERHYNGRHDAHRLTVEERWPIRILPYSIERRARQKRI